MSKKAICGIQSSPIISATQVSSLEVCRQSAGKARTAHRPPTDAPANYTGLQAI